MKNIKELNELQQFEFVKNYATESSYIKALEDYTKVIFNDIESAFNFLKLTFNSFNNERKGTSFTRWQHLNTHFSDWFINDYLSNDNVEGFNKLLNEDKKIELYSKKCYSVTITKNNEQIEVVVETFAHINLLEGTIQWLDEEQAKLMISRKINAIHKS